VLPNLGEPGVLRRVRVRAELVRELHRVAVLAARCFARVYKFFQI
jgi:hypothetical protein